MVTSVQLKAVFLVALLLGAEARRVKHETASLEASSPQSAKDVKATHTTAGRSTASLSAINLGCPPNGNSHCGGKCRMQDKQGLADNAEWADLLRERAQFKGAGMLVKPVITSAVSNKTAGTSKVVVSTRAGLISEGSKRATPWAWLAKPAVVETALAALTIQVALTVGELIKLQHILQDPVKLAMFLSKVPGAPDMKTVALKFEQDMLALKKLGEATEQDFAEVTGKLRKRAEATEQDFVEVAEKLQEKMKKIGPGPLRPGQPGFAWPRGQQQKVLDGPEVGPNRTDAAPSIFSRFSMPPTWGLVARPPPLPPPSTGIVLSKLVEPRVALAMLVTLVLVGGGIWAFHYFTRQEAYDQAFCPRSNWAFEVSAFQHELPGGELLKDSVNTGMPRCEGYFYVKVPVDCALDDVACRHLACQQSCCDHKGCKAYQFANRDRFRNAPSSFIHFGHKMMGCWLREETSKESDCERRWFGERLSNFGPELLNRDNASALLETKLEGRWDLEGKLLHKVSGLTSVSPPSVADVCSSVHLETNTTATAQVREQCERDQCRKACISKGDCIFYQYQRKLSSDYESDGWTGVDGTCWVGLGAVWRPTEKALDTYHSSEWYGGELLGQDGTEGKRTGCGDGQLACPSNGNCVTSCKDCNGFALPSDGICAPSLEQSICDPNSWVDEYNGMSLSDAECDGLSSDGIIHTTVTVDEDAEMNGHAICQEVCCAQPGCKLYQIKKRHAQTRQYRKGSKLTCRLGIVDSHQTPKFKCTKRANMSEGGYLFSRGCPSGTLACIVSNDCVASCSQCTGANFEDASGTSCTHIPGEDFASEGEQEIQLRQEGRVDDWISPSLENEKEGEDEYDLSEPEAPGVASRELSFEEEEDVIATTTEQGDDCPHPPCLVAEGGDSRADSFFYLADLQGGEDTTAMDAETMVRMGEYHGKCCP